MKNLKFIIALLISLNIYSVTHFERQLESLKLDDQVIGAIIENINDGARQIPMVPLDTGKKVMVLLSAFNENGQVVGMTYREYVDGKMMGSKSFKGYKKCHFKMKISGTPATMHIDTCNNNFRLRVKSFIGTHLDAPAKIGAAHTGEKIILADDGSNTDEIIYSVEVEGKTGIALLGDFEANLDELKRRIIKPKNRLEEVIVL